MRTTWQGWWFLTLVVTAGLPVACRDKGTGAPEGASAPAAAAPDPFQLPESDERMVSARYMAGVSVSGFIDALRAPKASHSGFALRTAGPGGRPVWVGDVTYDGHTFKGRVRNAPYLPAGAPGAEMKVKRADITDWLYVDNGRMVGGFTVRAIRDSLAADKRAELGKRLPFRIE